MINAQVIEGFERALLLQGFDGAAEIPECHREWWNACCSPNRFVALAAPRGFAKSTAITHTYVLAKILFRESSFVIIVSDSESQATLFLNGIKKELTLNEELRSTFGVVGFEKEAETDVIVNFADGHQVRLMAKGSEQKLRGFKWHTGKKRGGHKRPDLIVCDDMENDELVMNKERRKKFKDWFYGSLIPILSDKGILRVVGTILHFDSLLNGFMPQPKAKTTRETPLKRYSVSNSGWYALLYRAHDKTFENLLWPDKRPKEWLLEQRAMYERDGLLDVYAREYLNNPIDESNTHFRRSDFLDEKEEDADKLLTYYISFDGAWSKDQTADYTVFLVAGIDQDGYIYLKHVIKERVDPLEFADILFSLVEMYDPVMVLTEKGAFHNSVEPAIMKRMEEEDVYFRIETFATTTDKVYRSQAIRLRARAGRVKVDKSKDWWPDFEDELLTFPSQGHDDQVDAFSLIGTALQKFYEAPTRKEVEEEEWEEEKRESGMYEQGRCELTGY